MSLFRTELRRFGMRRVTRWMAVVGVLILGCVAAFVFAVNQKAGPDRDAQAARAADSAYQEVLQSTRDFRAQCEQARAAGTATARDFPADCSTISDPDREAFNGEDFLASTFDFRRDFPTTLGTVAAVLALVAFAVGASFVGAEWSTGGMMTMLLWRPRRLEVLRVKLAALLTGLAGLTVAVLTLWTVTMWVAAVLRGSTKGMTAGTWASFALTGLRGLTLVLVAGAIGFALASLGRQTALALGGALAVGLVGQTAVAFMVAMANVRFPDAWLLPTYLNAWMDKRYSVIDATFRGCPPAKPDCQPDTLVLTWQTTGAVLAVLVTVLVGAAMWSMRRRDI